MITAGSIGVPEACAVCVAFVFMECDVIRRVSVDTYDLLPMATSSRNPTSYVLSIIIDFELGIWVACMSGCAGKQGRGSPKATGISIGVKEVVMAYPSIAYRFLIVGWVMHAIRNIVNIQHIPYL